MLSALQKNIKNQLSNKNISVAELERRAGIPHAVVNIMHGRSKNPSIKIAQAIAKELGCTVEELLNCQSATKSSINQRQQEYVWDPKLAADCIQFINNFIGEHQIENSFQEVNRCLIEIYNYCMQCAGNDAKQAIFDQRFANWYLENNLGSYTK